MSSAWSRQKRDFPPFRAPPRKWRILGAARANDISYTYPVVVRVDHGVVVRHEPGAVFRRLDYPLAFFRDARQFLRTRTKRNRAIQSAVYGKRLIGSLRPVKRSRNRKQPFFSYGFIWKKPVKIIVDSYALYTRTVWVRVRSDHVSAGRPRVEINISEGLRGEGLLKYTVFWQFSNFQPFHACTRRLSFILTETLIFLSHSNRLIFFSNDFCIKSFFLFSKLTKWEWVKLEVIYAYIHIG